MPDRFLNAALLTIVSAVLSGFIDRDSPDAALARLVLMSTAGIMLLTILTMNDE